MPKRYINAVEAEARIKELFADMPKIDFMDNIRNWREKNKQYLQCLNVIRSLPTADVQEVKHGKWIDRYNDGDWHCSICGAIVEKDEQTYRNWYWCYHCGADMREEAEDAE